MNELLMDTLIDKVDSLEKQTGALKERIAQLPNYSEALEGVNKRLDLLNNKEQPASFPEKEIQHLTVSLKEAAFLLRQLAKKEITHHHHVPKLLWITAGLFLLLCILSAGWFITEKKLDAYKASDTKYRYLKLQSGESLQSLLRTTDSLYDAMSSMRDSVIWEEGENERKLLLLRQAMEKEKEADELRKKAKSD